MKYWSKSWNTVYGCTAIRAGCKECWARAMAKRQPDADKLVDGYGNWTGRIIYKPERLPMPYSWRKPQIVAVDWMSDIFHANAPAGLWADTLRVMSDTSQHTYLILTKRYGALLMKLYPGDAAPNVYIGVTISNQADADEARDCLAFASASYWKTWVSYEPALEPVDWTGYEFLDGLVCGSESGPRSRPMPDGCAASARDFCRDNGIPFTFKQDRGDPHPLLDGVPYYEFPKGISHD